MKTNFIILGTLVTILIFSQVSQAAPTGKPLKEKPVSQIIDNRIFGDWIRIPEGFKGECSCKIVASIDLECTSRYQWVGAGDSTSSRGRAGELGQYTVSGNLGAVTQNTDGNFVQQASCSGYLLTAAVAKPNECRTDDDCQSYCAQPENLGVDGIPLNLALWQDQIQRCVENFERSCDYASGVFTQESGYHLSTTSGTPVMCSYQFEGSCR